MRFIVPLCWIPLLLISLNFSGCKNKQSHHIDTVSAPIIKTVRAVRMAHPYYMSRISQKTDAFYKANEYQRIWLNKKRPDKNFKAFVKEVKECANYGMNPDDYAIDVLEDDVNALYKNRHRSDADLAKLDIQITA